MSFLEIWQHWTIPLARGAVITIQLASIGLVASLIMGLPIAAFRLAPFAPARFAARAYVDVVRGTPELLLLFLIFFGLAEVGIRLSAFVSTGIWLALVGSASVAEIYRAGIAAVDPGQVEAARALGLRTPSVYRRVVLPQALVIVLPSLVNVLILIVKGTALAFTIGVVELMGQASLGAGATYQTLPLYLEAALFYFVICYPLSLGVRRLERVAARYR
jgi:His/Glu/Gln/Arg/opine family amino acid ABC transporter permease subunit